MENIQLNITTSQHVFRRSKIFKSLKDMTEAHPSRYFYVNTFMWAALQTIKMKNIAKQLRSIYFQIFACKLKSNHLCFSISLVLKGIQNDKLSLEVCDSSVLLRILKRQNQML
ncbi:CLUMA_CG000279, isoform A [Clunio marinus]|uniref:CLUMA_CG000279, isoform A n=1 Tax=Clunio marinus TaxID=568069 RepID=A0A1J1HFA9_9DIPT|nr:CLUMA_CG000371, isoform A [Clunio marinus]CRK86523.1 CLUMA_CG000279, isoform A [Clunio marinus]